MSAFFIHNMQRNGYKMIPGSHLRRFRQRKSLAQSRAERNIPLRTNSSFLITIVLFFSSPLALGEAKLHDYAAAGSCFNFTPLDANLSRCGLSSVER
jgi:hypothetical protein